MSQHVKGSWASYFLFFGLAGYVSAQNLPAIIESQYPPSNATRIARNTGIALHFAPNFVAANSQLSLRQTGSSTAISLRNEFSYYDPRGIDLVVQPATPLAANTSYTVTLASASLNYEFSFTTGPDLDTTSPRLVSVSPDPNSGAVDPAGPFLFQFDEPLLTPFPGAGLGTGLTRLSSDRRTILVTNLPQYSLPRVLDLVFETTHVRDICGNTLAAPIRTRFLTTVGRDMGTLRLLGHYPEAGEANVPIGSVISLLFSHEISSYTPLRGIVVEARGQPVPIQAYPEGAVVVVSGVSLLPNTTYKVRVDSQLVDAFGMTFDQPSSFEFTTASSPATYPSEEVRIGPQNSQTSIIPTNARIAVRSPRPLPRYVPLLFENTIPLLNPLPGRASLKASASLLEDRRVLVITPADPFDRTNVSYRLPSIFDVEGRRVLSEWSATITLQRDDEPPRIVSSTPSALSSGAPLNTAIRIKFNETIGLLTPSTAVGLLKDGARWPGTMVISDTAIDFKIAEPLIPESEYTIQLEGVTDVAGNVMPPQRISFRSGADSTVPSQFPRLIHSSLQDGDPDPAATVELEFNQPLRAGFSSATAMVFVPRTNDSPLQFDHPVRWNVDGATMRITPLVPWPSERDITLAAGSEDLWGRSVGYSATLRAKRSNDDVRPEVISISPPSGTPIGAGDRIVLTFSEPMLNASHVDAVIVVQSGFTAIERSTWSDDRRRLTLIASPVYLQSRPLDTQITVLATSALLDLAGNALVPMIARFPVLIRPAVTSLPTIIFSIPARNSSASLDASSPLTLVLSGPVSAADLNRALWVFTTAGHTAGTWEVSADGLVAVFRPQGGLWPAGSTLRLFQTEQLIDLTYSFETSIAPGRNPSLYAVRTSFSDTHPANKVIEIEFSQDLPADQPGPVILTGLNTSAIPYDEFEARPRVRRLVPRAVLPVGAILSFSTRPGSSLVWPYGIPQTRVVAPIEPEPISGVYRSPADQSRNVPRNARISLVMKPQLNPLSIADSTVSISANGRAIPVRYSTETNPAGPLQIFPQELLPPDSEIQVRLIGLSDQIGRRVGIIQWAFRTGNSVDLTPPKLLYSNLPPGNNAFAVEPSAQLRLVFDEPIDAASLALFLQGSGEPGAWELSEDLRTISRRVPENPGVSFRPPQVTDLSGNSFSDSGTVYIGFENNRSAVVLRAASPRDGQTGLPLNLKIGLLFDRPMGTDVLAGIRLMRGIESIRLGQASITAQSRVSFGPDEPLDPNTEYQLIIEGVQDPSGNRLATPRVIRFTTGVTYDIAAPVGTFRFLSRAIPLRVRFSEPLDETSTFDLSQVLTYTDGAGYPRILKASLELSADRRDVTVIPQQELQAGVDYTIDLSPVSDLAGLSGRASFRFRVVDNPDTSAPRIRVYPPDGTTNVPTNASVSVVFSRLTDTPPLRMFENDKLVLAVPSLATTNVPMQRTLKPSSQYRIEADGYRDEFGNEIPPLISSFTTAAADDRTALEFVSASPEQGAAGVPVDTPWKITFNKILSPTVFPEFSSSESRQFPYSISSESIWNQFVVQPKPAWPAAYSLQLTLSSSGRFGVPSISDLAGNRLRTSISFTMRTAAVSDSTPPVLESVTPAPGTLLSGTPVTIALRFSEPVSTGNAVQFYFGAQLTSVSGVYSADLRTVTYTLRPTDNSRITIIGTDGIRDNGDNPIAPFVLEYPTGEAPPSGPPRLLQVEPFGGIEVAPSVTPLLRFDRVMNSDSVIRALRVTENSVLVSGTVEVLADGREYRFRPNAPFKARAEIRVFLIRAVMDLDDRAIQSSYDPYSLVAVLTVAGPLPMSVLQRGFESTAPADSILEVELDREIDRTSVHADSVWLREGSHLVPGYASLRDGRILQFTPAVPLDAGVAYVLTAGAALRGLDGSDFAGQDLPFRAGPQAEHAEIDSVENTEWEGRPAVRVRFTAPVSPLAARSLRIERDGRTEASTALRSTDAREVWLIPSNAAPGPVAVGMDWVPARNGRPIAARRLQITIGGERK